MNTRICFPVDYKIMSIRYTGFLTAVKTENFHLKSLKVVRLTLLKRKSNFFFFFFFYNEIL